MHAAAALLRAARRDAGLTQREVAAKAGVTQPVVAAYEGGRRQPTVPMLDKLLRASGRELDLQTKPTRWPSGDDDPREPEEEIIMKHRLPPRPPSA